MNKLKKTIPPNSTNGSPVKSIVAAGKPVSNGANGSNPIPFDLEPLGAKEQYWAARALKAEALLAAKEMHHREVKTMTYSQDIKRTREISQLIKQHEAKHESLEKLVLLLTGTIILLVLIIIYLSIHHARQASKAQKPWLAGLPSHFTIPILSPFTSVVEKETSIFGTKAIAIIVIVGGVLVYFSFRHWLGSRTLTHSTS